MSSYVPTNTLIFTAAYAGCHAGLLQAKRVQESADPATYTSPSVLAGIWAELFDTAWADAATPDTLQMFEVQLQSFGLWSDRWPTLAEMLTQETSVNAIIASITAGESWFAGESIAIPLWGTGSGGGGTGNGVPLVPPNSVGWSLESTNSTGSDQLPIDYSAWTPPGGDAISTFTVSGAATIEIGVTLANPTIAATYTATPLSAEVVYSQQPGSPKVLTTPFTSGSILETFTFTSNEETVTFELEATWASTTGNRTVTKTCGEPYLELIAPTGSVVATQGFLASMRTANGAQIHTSATGTYLNDQNVGSGQISCIAIPEDQDVGVVWTDLLVPATVSPNFVGTVAYTNPAGTTLNMNLYTVGGVDVGPVSWGLS